MKLIGASYPRTGTLSTKAALEQLGLGPCYHFVTQFERPQDIDVWQTAEQAQAFSGDPRIQEFFGQLFEGAPEITAWVDSGWNQW